MALPIMWCCEWDPAAGKLGADMDIEAEYCGSSYGGGGKPSDAVGEPLDRTIELSEGEKMLPLPNWVAWKP